MSTELKPTHLESVIKYWTKICQKVIYADLKNAVLGKGPFKS